MNVKLSPALLVFVVLSLLVWLIMVARPQTVREFLGELLVDNDQLDSRLIQNGDRSNEIEEVRDDEKKENENSDVIELLRQTENLRKQVSLYKPALDYEEAVIEAVDQAMRGVVSVSVIKPVAANGAVLWRTGKGSGFVVEGDLILTNKHVVLGDQATYAVFTNENRQFEAELVALDPILDLAILRAPGLSLPPLALGDSDSVKLGQTAIAIGNALGEFQNTVSVGIISGLARNITANGIGISEELQGLMQTDAAINNGNSGGPLLNLRGEVIGINVAVASDAENIGFAIPINEISRSLKSVRKTGDIKVPFLGVQYFENPDGPGVILGSGDNGPAVTPGSPAAQAGLLDGDVVIAVNDEKVVGLKTLFNLISNHEIGDTIWLKILRGGHEKIIPVILVERQF